MMLIASYSLGTLATLVVPAIEPVTHVSGVVTCDGKPITGAMVMVNRAWPRVGPAFYCPGCYADCGKSARTDADGNWKIDTLDPDLKFELLVVSRDHVPLFTRPIDPSKREPVAATLKARDLSKVPATHLVRGKVVDDTGAPIEHATVSPEMVWFADHTGRGGSVEGLDPLAVTDEKGDFTLAYFGPCEAMDLIIHARGFAMKCSRRVPAGVPTPPVFELIEGATITGRLVLNGAPVSKVEMGLCPTSRFIGTCFDHYTIATDAEGKFTFFNVPPQGDFVVYAVHDSAARLGSLPVTPLKVITNAEIVNVGDLAMKPGRRVSGRVLFPDGKKAPAGAKISLNHDLAWDSSIIDLAPDGRFEFTEMPDGVYSLNVMAPGFHLAPINLSYERVNQMLWGKIESNVVDLQVQMVDVAPNEEPEPRPDPSKREIGGIEKTDGKNGGAR
jgi:hypothetical protein